MIFSKKAFYYLKIFELVNLTFCTWSFKVAWKEFILGHGFFCIIKFILLRYDQQAIQMLSYKFLSSSL